MFVPNFEHEQELWQKGHRLVAGVDEVGRGAWAGPLVAAAATFNPSVLNDSELMEQLEDLRDSKKLTPKRRQSFVHLFEDLVKKLRFNYALGAVDPATIDRHGMTSATGRAMRLALHELRNNLQADINHTLVDAFHIRYLRKRDHTPIKKGDEKSITIAAASVVAKEYRDALMRRYAKRQSFSVYRWETNVGYGTKEHQEAIKEHGICPLHRQLFIPHYLLG